MNPTDFARDPRQAAAYRILDANLNRCHEGLRVMEEYLRFVVEDVHLSTLCKQLRHDLAAVSGPLAKERLHAMRDVAGDVGTGIATLSEYQRYELKDVMTANVRRVEQSLRGLEEYAKILSPDLAAGFESLRYRVYTLERCLTTWETSVERLAAARLYVLLDGRESPSAFRQLVTALVRGGVAIVQLRDKTLPDRALLERARWLRELTSGSSTLFIMNDRVDLAAAARADGVHLGQDELPAKEARGLLGPDALIGVSTHGIEQARQAVLDGANYIGCGPTFPSATKRFQHFPGLEYLRQVSREIALPAFAIGGIDADNVAEVRQAGISRVAVSHSVIDQPDPEQASRALAARLFNGCS